MSAVSQDSLKKGLDKPINYNQSSPRDNGVVKLLVIRPETHVRTLPNAVVVSVEQGVVGDKWEAECTIKLENGKSNPDLQIAIINTKVIKEIAQSDFDMDRLALAGDNIYADLNLCEENMPVGQQIQIGNTLLEVTPFPHFGCKKFSERYSVEDLKVVNSTAGKPQHLRGIYVKVIKNGSISIGESIKKI